MVFVMKALLDTNIIIHREASRVISRDIGNLFKWLDRLQYEKCIHKVTVDEIEKNQNEEVVAAFRVKMQSYSQMSLVAKLAPEVKAVAEREDRNDHDLNDTVLLNELFVGRVDVLISEDRGIHRKAKLLDVGHRVFGIDSFLEKCVAEHPEQVDYRVLNVRRRRFGELNLCDPFFDTLKADYPGFDKWFNTKSEEYAYVTTYRDGILSFLYLKEEDRNEPYSDIEPAFAPKRRLKVGTFKVIATGFRLGERFLKIIFDNAIRLRVDEIYVTVLEKRDDQRRLIALLEKWGFRRFGLKHGPAGSEVVFVRDMVKAYNPEDPRLTFPFFSRSSKVYLVPINPRYHTDLLPDSILRSESAADFMDPAPHRNGITKAYISHASSRDLHRGDLIVFYRGGGVYKGVVTTVGIVQNVYTRFQGEDDFLAHCRKHSVFTDDELRKVWNAKSWPPFVIEFLCAYSFPKRPNLARLIETGVVADVYSAPHYPTVISKEKFDIILKESRTDESVVVD